MVARRPRTVEPSEGAPEMSESKWVVYRLGSSGFVDKAKAHLWDSHVRHMNNKGKPVTLTLLARGLTKEQAEQFVELTKEEI